jgi:hypothetical protein
MVIDSSKHIDKLPVSQASRELASKPNKINANTAYNFAGKDLTPYGGLFPVATTLEKLGFRQPGRGKHNGVAHSTIHAGL